MTRLLAIVLTPLLLAGCNTHPVYTSMSDAEIVAYNQTRQPAEQVICVMRTSLASRIPRRECKTRLEFYMESSNNAALINTASSGLSIF